LVQHWAVKMVDSWVPSSAVTTGSMMVVMRATHWAGLMAAHSAASRAEMRGETTAANLDTLMAEWKAVPRAMQKVAWKAGSKEMHWAVKKDTQRAGS